MEYGLIVAVVLVFLLAVLAWYLKRQADSERSLRTRLEQEHAQIQAELTRLREQWDTVTENVVEGVILIDADATVLFINSAAKGFLRTGEGLGRDFNQLALGWEFVPLVREVLAMNADSLSQTVAKDERVFQVRVRAISADTRRGALIVMSEVTELQRLGRIRRDFVANISHELRTPVTTMGLLAETLASELPADNLRLQEHVVKLRGQIDLLRQLSNEMMDLALIESGRMPMQLIEASAADWVNQVLEALRPQAERKQIALEVDVPGDLRVLADPSGVSKVLSNLIHNAIKFTPAGGRIAISARGVEENNVEFRIADTGVGIPTRDLPRIFERFYKVDRARTAGEIRGTGLGLAIAKHVVEGHGGKIWVESAEGKGATFYFTLPGVN
jgi:two-component system phosphate regulon sensor histidine kinase PhoR